MSSYGQRMAGAMYSTMKIFPLSKQILKERRQAICAYVTCSLGESGVSGSWCRYDRKLSYATVGTIGCTTQGRHAVQADR